MKGIAFLLAALGWASGLFAQLPPIDPNALNKWESIGNPSISSDGKYVGYVIYNRPAENRTLVIESIDQSWKREYRGISIFELTACYFSASNRQAIFQIKDTLWFIGLGNQETSFVTPIRSVRWPATPTCKWVAYQLANADNTLVVRSLLTNQEKKYGHVAEYLFDGNGNALLVRDMKQKADTVTTTLSYITLDQWKETTIWSGNANIDKSSPITGYTFNNQSDGVVFLYADHGHPQNSSIWCYEPGMERAKKWVTPSIPGVNSSFEIGSRFEFSKNGRWLFFDLKEPPEILHPHPAGAKVDVWTYKDPIMQPEQTLLPTIKSHHAVVNTLGNPEVRLLDGLDRLETIPSQVKGDYVVIADNYVFQNFFPAWWTHSPQPSYYLLSLKDGTRKLLKWRDYSLDDFSFSPDGNFLVYYDWKRTAFYSCDVSTGTIRNISKCIPTSIIDTFGSEKQKYSVGPVVSWYDNDDAVINDNYDLWRIDISAQKKPINLTNGFGIRHHIRLRLVYGRNPGERDNARLLTDQDSLLLVAYNDRTKYNGFYEELPGKVKDPILLSMGPYTFYHSPTQVSLNGNEFDRGIRPIKAATTYRWIVTRQTATQAPNYFVTDDFKNYVPISNICPQVGYNWLTAELINWKDLDGTPAQGILYKPKDFDPHKKYPIIFHYYQRLSNRLFEFPVPGFTRSSINIPWFASRGYLVFTPDVNVQASTFQGKSIGSCVYNSVISAAEFLSHFPYINSHKMGLQGHSFGGQETNYLITHTHLFAAAAEAAGVSDPVSKYLTFSLFFSSGDPQNPTEAYSGMTGFETHGGGMGGSLWQIPEVYKANSAVLSADKVTTPLLIMHNKLDDQIQWRQGVELYLALRRLDKKVWMLQYDGEQHVLNRKDDQVDYSIRLTQFFGYYLKDEPAPVWMTKGIPLQLKGTDMGYEFDKPNTIP